MCENSALHVTQKRAEIVVENISTVSIAIRISWDKKDPFGAGAGGDSVLRKDVAPNTQISVPLKGHISVQVWAWDDSARLVDSCDQELK